MESKYDFPNKTKKFQVFKPRPIVFNIKNGPSSPKKAKFSHNDGGHQNTNGNRVKPSIQEQKRKLPVYQHRLQLLNHIQRQDTLIILGETGSGKTTQIPQYIYSARLQGNKKIAITQPRRVAAISVAMRVAQEMGTPVGETVGFTVRFEDTTSNKTVIKYLTDGMLLREAIADRLLLNYNVVMLDEAHERTIHTDVLFGIVKEAQKVRKEQSLTPLKVILMSATMDVDHFSKYFNNCRALYLEGRTFPVEVFYTKKAHEDYQAATVATFFKIHQEAPPNHDVLIFLTGQEEIETVAHQIRMLAKDPEVEGPAIRVCTLYAAQSGNAQMQVFNSAPENTRKVIVGTNIAETSVTISGIKYVIDAGMVKARTYNPSTGLDLLKVQRISQEQAWQRAGRAGRESEGSCYRIYTKYQFDTMSKSSLPEIQRANLNIVALQLLALGIHAGEFDFMDKPPRDLILAAFEQLKLLGAIESKDSKKLTPLGKQMANFPLDPRFSKILLSASAYGCVEEALTIVAILSGESIFHNPPHRRAEAHNARQKFCSPYGDHVTLLNVFREYLNVGVSNKSWCMEHYVSHRNLLYAREVRSQLLEICKKCDIAVNTCGSNMDQIRKCLIAGLFMNVAELHKDKNYVSLDKKQVVHIHPSSMLHGQKPAYILYTEVVQTSKCYLRNVSTIEEGWLEEIVPDYLRTHHIRCKD